MIETIEHILWAGFAVWCLCFAVFGWWCLTDDYKGGKQ